MKALYDDLRIGGVRYVTYAGVMNAERAVSSFKYVIEEVRRHRWEDATWTFVSTWGDVKITFSRRYFKIKRVAFGVVEELKTTSITNVLETLRNLDKPLLPYGKAFFGWECFKYEDVCSSDMPSDMLQFALMRIAEFGWIELTWKFFVYPGRIAVVERFKNDSTLRVLSFVLGEESDQSFASSSPEEVFRFITQL